MRRSKTERSDIINSRERIRRNCLFVKTRIAMIIPDKKKKLKQESPKKNTPEIKIFLLIGVVCISLFIFQSHLATQIFPFKRELLLKNFLTKVLAEKKVDAQAYWEFREFYSPGSFDYSTKGLNKNILDGTTRNNHLLVSKKDIDRIFLNFKSSQIISFDMLTTSATLSAIVRPDTLLDKEILLQNRDTIIYREKAGNILILFLKSRDEMKTANGFFDYRDIDKDLVKNKNWVNITSITQ